MTKRTNLAAIISLLLACVTLILGYFQDSFARDILMALFGTFFGAFVAIVIVNIYLSSAEKQIAAAPLLNLLEGPINRYHNDLFIELGRQKFGIARWNSLIDDYQNNGRNPAAFSPEDRAAISAMIDTRIEDIMECIKELEQAMLDLLTVLGWSFDPKAVGAAILCKTNISVFRLNMLKSEASDELKKVEMYFDIDGSSNTVRRQLITILGLDPSNATTSVNPNG